MIRHGRVRTVGNMWNLASVCALLLSISPPAASQQGKLIREKIHGVSLQNNVIGEPVDRYVSIYLPPSYDINATKRYPAVYLLHGINDTDETWTAPDGNDAWSTIQGLMDRGIADKAFGEMIIIMPDERTKFIGSFYTNSTSTGNWEDFTTKDLVSYIDRKYRTLGQVSSRGIAGHSMGGYGAFVLGMKHPEVFSVVYSMSPAVLGWAKDWTIDSPSFPDVLPMTTLPPLQDNHLSEYDWAIICVAQAFSPNPTHPPFFADFPFEIKNGKLRLTPAEKKWEEHMPLYIVSNYAENLMKLRGIRFDAGFEDEFTHIPVTAHALSDRLTSLGIEHQYDEYNGDHRNRLWGRNGRIYTRVLPYMWALLDSAEKPR